MMEQYPDPEGPWTQVAPGIYENATGERVFNAADILAECGLEDTTENRTAVKEALAELINTNRPEGYTVMVRDESAQWRRLCACETDGESQRPWPHTKESCPWGGSPVTHFNAYPDMSELKTSIPNEEPWAPTMQCGTGRHDECSGTLRIPAGEWPCNCDCGHPNVAKP